MPMLAGKTAIVTGSSQGIGQGIATRLAREGANVVIDYIGGLAGANATLKMVQDAGAKGIICEADVSQVSAVQNLVSESWKKFGSADILVNNAGMEHKSDLD